MMKGIFALLLGVIVMGSVHAEGEKIKFAGDAITLDKPEWLLPVNKASYAKKYPGRRYPGNYHESKDGKLSFYSEIDRDAEGKSIEAIHKAAIALQNESFPDVLTWNKKAVTSIGGKKFSLLDFNIKDPDGDKELTFRMIVLDTLADGKVSHTIITLKDKEAEKAFLGKLYKWLQLEGN